MEYAKPASSHPWLYFFPTGPPEPKRILREKSVTPHTRACARFVIISLSSRVKVMPYKYPPQNMIDSKGGLSREKYDREKGQVPATEPDTDRSPVSSISTSGHNYNAHSALSPSPASPSPQPWLLFSPSVPNRHPSPLRTCLSQSHQCPSTRWPPWGGPAASSSTTASPRPSGTVSFSSPPSTLRSPSPTMSASRVTTTPPSLLDTPLSVTSPWRCSSFWVRPFVPHTLVGGLEGPTHPSLAASWTQAYRAHPFLDL